MANDFSAEYSTFSMKEFNFLISFKIELLDNSRETRKFFDDNDVDIFEESPVADVSFPTLSYKKLSKYIKVFYKSRYRHSDDEGNVWEEYYVADFRNC